jgi:hypothetical protein
VTMTDRATRRTVFGAVGPLDETLRDTGKVEYGTRLAQGSQIQLSPFSAFAEPGCGKPGSAEPTWQPLAVAAVFSTALCLSTAPRSAVRVLLGAAGLVVFTEVEGRLPRLASRHAGLRFMPVLYAPHALMNLATSATAVVGVVRRLVSGDFRRLYVGSPKPVAPAQGGPADA